VIGCLKVLAFIFSTATLLRQNRCTLQIVNAFGIVKEQSLGPFTQVALPLHDVDIEHWQSRGTAEAAALQEKDGFDWTTRKYRVLFENSSDA